MAGRRFAVVTDSTADLPADWRDRYGIEVVPLRVLFGNQSYKDGVDLTGAQFFEKLAAADKLPTTSAPAPGDFAAVYERLASDHDGAISIHISETLSGTAGAARMGAEAVPGFDVRVIDSKLVTMCLAFLCQVAAEQATLDAAVAEVEARVPRQKIIAILDTLRYLEMGGRLNRAQAMIGSMLDLKPILGLSGEDGAIKPLDRVRTRGRAIARGAELRLADGPIERLNVMHAESPEDAERLRAEVAGHYPGLGIGISSIGAVLGTHTGPRALGFAYLRK